MQAYGPDRYEFTGGMIRWFFTVDGGIYQVNSQSYWESFPAPDVFALLYRHDKKRLTRWLEERKIAPVSKPPPQPYWAGPLVAPAPEKRPKKKSCPKVRAHQWERFWVPDTVRFYGASLSTNLITDRDWIEAMFTLYSQGRTRLL